MAEGGGMSVAAPGDLVTLTELGFSGRWRPRLQHGDCGLVLAVSEYGGFRHVLWSRINKVQSVHANHLSVQAQHKTGNA